jgi:hypothetical protein
METIPAFEDLTTQRRNEKNEVLRLAKGGVFSHESELIYADDPRLAEWAKRIPEVR